MSVDISIGQMDGRREAEWRSNDGASSLDSARGIRFASDSSARRTRLVGVAASSSGVLAEEAVDPGMNLVDHAAAGRLVDTSDSQVGLMFGIVPDQIRLMGSSRRFDTFPRILAPS